MKIKAIASAVPDHEFDAETIAEWIGAEPEFIQNKVGAKHRYFLAEDETGVELAQKAVEALLAKTGLEKDDIELIVYVTQNPEYFVPHNSAVLHGKMDLPPDVAAFDIGLACSGYVYALIATKGFMAAQGLNNAVIVTCDPYSKIMRRDDRGTVAVFGDAATATLLQADGIAEIGYGDFGTDGSQNDVLIVPAGGASRPIYSIYSDEPQLQGEDDEHRLHMGGRAVFNFVLSNVPGSLNRSLERNGLTMDDIDYFALHQGSLYMLVSLARLVGIPNDKLLVNIDRYANTISSTIPLLLEDLMNDQDDLSGKRVLVSGFGAGLSWGSLPITFD